DLGAAGFGDPLGPIGPPGAGVFFRRGEPTLRIGRTLVVRPIAVFVARRRVDDAGDVAGGPEYEAHRALIELGGRIGGGPGRDVILARGDDVGWRLDLAQIDRRTRERDAAGLDEFVRLVHVAQVEAVHGCGHAR